MVQSAFPVVDPRIVLLDPNQACLDTASDRLSRYDPSCVRASALAPLPHLDRFDSISLTYVLHCLPGPMVDKAVVFDHLTAVLEPDAVVFGATLLSGGVHRNWYARSVMAFNNRRGIFSNEADGLDSLTHELAVRFDDVEVKVVGCVGVFSARARPA